MRGISVIPTADKQFCVASRYAYLLRILRHSHGGTGLGSAHRPRLAALASASSWANVPSSGAVQIPNLHHDCLAGVVWNELESGGGEHKMSTLSNDHHLLNLRVTAKTKSAAWIGIIIRASVVTNSPNSHWGLR